MTGVDWERSSADHFEQMHRASEDPWDFRSSPYERRKYAITVACLPKQRYERAWEPGCSIGELTVLLAERAARIDASDISETAVSAARQATRALAGVQVQRAQLPAAPPGRYDLIVFSEVLYYLPSADREMSLRQTELAATDDADLVVVHWRHLPSDAWISGADANAEVRNRPGWRSLARHDEPDFVLDVLTRDLTRDPGADPS